jgi:thiamine biosynthesis lipoprotein ApbE
MMILGSEAGLKLAEKKGIAAAFLVRDESGFTETRSSTFPSPKTP